MRWMTEMQEYRRIALTIRAIQYHEHGRNRAEVLAAGGNNVCLAPAVERVVDPGDENVRRRVMVLHDLWVHTKGGSTLLNPGDWLVQGTGGDFYPCKDEIFQAINEVL